MSCLVSSIEALVGRFMASAKSRSCAPLSLGELKESVSPSGNKSVICCNFSSFDCRSPDRCSVVHGSAGEGVSRWDLHFKLCQLLARSKLCCSAISHKFKNHSFNASIPHIYNNRQTMIYNSRHRGAVHDTATNNTNYSIVSNTLVHDCVTLWRNN